MRASGAGCIAVFAVSAALGCRQLLSIDENTPTIALDGGLGDLADASAEADAENERYCATLDPQPQFCSDFDEGPVIRGWSNAGASIDPFVTGGGTLVRDENNFRSAPYGASMGVPNLLAPSAASVALVMVFTQGPKNILVEFAVRIDTEDFREPDQVVSLLSLTFPQGAYSISRGADGLSLMTYDGTVEAIRLSSQPFLVGSWRRVSLIVTSLPTTENPSGEVSLRVEGVLAAKLPRPEGVGDEDRTYLGIGVIAARGNMGAFRATFDNITFTSDAPLGR